MSKYYISLYIVVAALVTLTYGAICNFFTITLYEKITISNLTFNYVIMSTVWGGFTGWYGYNRLFVKRDIVIRFVGTCVLAFLAAVLWLLIVSLGGYKLRWA